MNTSRPGRSRRSAELHSAVSRICNLPRVATGVALPTASRRYSRLQICATGFGQFDKYFAQAEKTFMAGITTLDWGVRNAEYRTIPSPPRASLQEPAGSGAGASPALPSSRARRPRHYFAAQVHRPSACAEAKGGSPRTVQSARTDSCCICDMKLSNRVRGPNARRKSREGSP